LKSAAMIMDTTTRFTTHHLTTKQLKLQRTHSFVEQEPNQTARLREMLQFGFTFGSI